MVESLSATLIIVLGIINVLLYFFISRKRKKKIAFVGVLNAFLHGFVPYGAFASFYSGLTGKILFGPVNDAALGESYRVMLIVAGLSLGWLYYHLFLALKSKH